MEGQLKPVCTTVNDHKNFEYRQKGSKVKKQTNNQTNKQAKTKVNKLRDSGTPAEHYLIDSFLGPS